MLKQVDLGGYCLNTGITEVLSKKKNKHLVYISF